MCYDWNLMDKLREV